MNADFDSSQNEYLVFFMGGAPHPTFIEFSDETGEEIHASIHMPVNKQVELACKKISKDPNLQKGYNAIGYSQVTVTNNCLNISVAHHKKKINLLQFSNLS